ncbi:MAG: M67 family metallopeptidase [Gammaproteobacteria bacterium]|jgi:proteasome lid subunit RPN8/RPN11
MTATRSKHDRRSPDITQTAAAKGTGATGPASRDDSGVGPGSRLRLRRGLEARLGVLVSSGYPEETCGLLLGHRKAQTVEVLELVQVRNLNRARAHDRYELDPDGYMAADLQAREEGRGIVGVWHSHPDNPARPSATDRERAWEGWSYLIASVTRDGVAELRSWRLHEGDFIEEVVK